MKAVYCTSRATRFTLYAMRYTLYAVFLLAAGCAPQFKANLDLSMQDRIFWPGPPEKPRIRYLWSLNSLVSEESQALEILAGKYEAFDARESPVLLRPIYVHRRADNLYVADFGARRVTVVNLKSMDVFHAGVDGKGELSFPVCVVSDPEGNIYVSDSTLQQVNMYDQKGNFLRALLSGKGRPVGLAYDDKARLLYVTDTANHTIYALEADGSVRFTIGKRGEGDGEFNFPTYLWIDPERRLYVSDTLNTRIQIFDADGKYLSSFGKLGGAYYELSSPKGVAADSHGNIYVVDGKQDMVKIFDRTGKLLLFLGDEGTEHGKFYLPNGIFIDANNTIYVADTYNMRIQAFQLIE